MAWLINAARLRAAILTVLAGLAPCSASWAQNDTPDQPDEPPPPAAPAPAAPRTVPAQVAPAAQREEQKRDERSSAAPAERSVDTNKNEAISLPPDFIKLYLMDGSVIAGRLSMKELAVETQFGSLSVPVTSIKSVTPGLASHPSLAKEISGLIADLGSSNYNDREKAQQTLVKMGPTIRTQLERFQNDNDVERRNRVKAILTEFEQSAEEDDAESDRSPSMQDRDTIETTEFTIVGKIVPQGFVVTSAYGELNVKLADIRRGEREAGKKEEVRQNFSVDATHLATRNALSTNIRVERGDIVTVTADGTLTMTPWGNAAITTPDGAQNYGWYIPGQIASGTLVGKIGNDNYMKLGSKSTFTAQRSGVLQLAIGMQADYSENQFPGKYNVKVRVQRKPGK
jgi:hypothetical protein